MPSSSRLLMSILLVAASATAQTDLNLSPTDDCTTIEGISDCQCNSTIIVADDYDAARGLLKFDLSTLPDNIEVTSATLRLYCLLQFEEVTTLTIAVANEFDWSESESNCPTWANQPGQFAYSTEPMNGDGKWYEFQVTDHVNEWVANGYPNSGFLLYTAAGTQVHFASSEYSINPAFRPELLVSYSNLTRANLSTSFRSAVFVDQEISFSFITSYWISQSGQKALPGCDVSIPVLGLSGYFEGPSGSFIVSGQELKSLYGLGAHSLEVCASKDGYWFDPECRPAGYRLFEPPTPCGGGGQFEPDERTILLYTFCGSFPSWPYQAIPDESGNGFDLTIQNLAGSNPEIVGGGRSGSCIEATDGASATLLHGSGAWEQPEYGEYTLEFYFRASGSEEPGFVISTLDSDGGGIYIGLNGSYGGHYSPGLTIYGGFSGGEYNIDPAPYLDGKWHHVVLQNRELNVENGSVVFAIDGEVLFEYMEVDGPLNLGYDGSEASRSFVSLQSNGGNSRVALDEIRLSSVARYDLGESTQAPIVLVHGWLSDPESWDYFRDDLVARGYLESRVWVADNLLPCGGIDEVHFEENAQLLADFIADKIQQYDISPKYIDIIGHSLGGLISRRLAATPGEFGLQPRIRNLVTLGSPHDGSEFGGYPARVFQNAQNVRCNSTFGTAWKALSTPDMLGFNVRFWRLEAANETEYFTFAGDAGCDSDGQQLGACLSDYFDEIGAILFPRSLDVPCPNDGIVSVESAHGQFVFSEDSRTDFWCHSPAASGFFSSTLTFQEDATVVRDYLGIAQSGRIPDEPQERPQLYLSGPPQAPPQMTLEECGDVAGASEVVSSFWAEAGTFELTALTTDTNAALILRDPNDNLVDSVYVTDNLGGLWEARAPQVYISFDNLVAGNWVAELTLPSSDSQLYCLHARLRNAIVATVGLSASEFLPDSALVVSAQVEVDGAPRMTGLVFAGAAISDDSQYGTLTFVDDGSVAGDIASDGKFVALLPTPPDTGVVEIHLQIDGETATGVAEFRRLHTLFAYYQMPICCVGIKGDIDCNGDVGLPDISVMIDHLFINFPTLCCFEEADLNGDLDVGLPDLSILVDHLLISFPPLGTCP